MKAKVAVICVAVETAKSYLACVIVQLIVMLAWVNFLLVLEILHVQSHVSLDMH